MFTDNQRSGTKSTELIYLPRLQGWQLFQLIVINRVSRFERKKVQFSPRLSISVNTRWKDVAATRDGNWQNEICFSFLQQCVVRIEIEIDELEVCVLVKWFLFCVSSVVWLNNFALCFIELVLETRICNFASLQIYHLHSRWQSIKHKSHTENACEWQLKNWITVSLFSTSRLFWCEVALTRSFFSMQFSFTVSGGDIETCGDEKVIFVLPLLNFLQILKIKNSDVKFIWWIYDINCFDTFGISLILFCIWDFMFSTGHS